jgi:hypothetical protein
MLVEETLRWRMRLRVALRGTVLAVITFIAMVWFSKILHRAIGYNLASVVYVIYQDEVANMLFASLAIGAALLFAERPILRWLVPLPKVECPQCGYSLRQLTTTRCPECGFQFTARSNGEPPTQS